MMYEFEQPFVVDSSKFEQAFGMKVTPLKEAIHETVEGYRVHSAKFKCRHPLPGVNMKLLEKTTATDIIQAGRFFLMVSLLRVDERTER